MVRVEFTKRDHEAMSKFGLTMEERKWIKNDMEKCIVDDFDAHIKYALGRREFPETWDIKDMSKKYEYLPRDYWEEY